MTDQTLTRFDLATKLLLTNRTGSPWNLQAADVEVWVDGVLSGSSHPTLGQTVPANGSLEIEIPATTEPIHDEASLKSWAARADRPVPVLMKGAIQLSDGGSTRDLPFSRAGELRAPRLPVAKIDDAELARYGDGEMGLAIFLGIDNQNPFPVHVKAISYHAALADKLVSEGIASTGDRLPASQIAEYEIDAKLGHDNGGPELTKLAESGKLVFTLDGTIDLDLTQIHFNLSGPLTFGKKKGGHHPPEQAPAASSPEAE
ncbi:MAG: LEA type 2 family protein [Deltaproteobacteria bacterium]